MSIHLPALLTSFFLILALLGIRQALISAVRRKSEVLSRDQRRWMSRIKNTIIIIGFLGIVMIWAPQLQALALSLTAVAVALVVATKEMILCLTGAFMRVTTTPFRVGDWVTVDGISGEVVDINAFSFRIQEVDIEGKSYQTTGRVIEVPNGKLFTSNIENLTFSKKYVFLDIPLTIAHGEISPDILLPKIEEIANEHYKPLAEDARRYNRTIEKKAGMDIPDPEPVVSLNTTDAGHLVYIVHAFVPTAQASQYNRFVTKDVLGFVYKNRAHNKSKVK